MKLFVVKITANQGKRPRFFALPTNAIFCTNTINSVISCSINNFFSAINKDSIHGSSSSSKAKRGILIEAPGSPAANGEKGSVEPPGSPSSGEGTSTAWCPDAGVARRGESKSVLARRRGAFGTGDAPPAAVGFGTMPASPAWPGGASAAVDVLCFLTGGATGEAFSSGRFLLESKEWGITLEQRDVDGLATVGVDSTVPEDDESFT